MVSRLKPVLVGLRANVLDQAFDPEPTGHDITLALCGDPWHSAGCRWPHTSHFTVRGRSTFLDVYFEAPRTEAEHVRDLVRTVLATHGLKQVRLIDPLAPTAAKYWKTCRGIDGESSNEGVRGGRRG